MMLSSTFFCVEASGMILLLDHDAFSSVFTLFR